MKWTEAELTYLRCEVYTHLRKRYDFSNYNPPLRDRAVWLRNTVMGNRTSRSIYARMRRELKDMEATYG